jgi:hypothetical protein
MLKPKLAKIKGRHGWSFSKEEDAFIKLCVGKRDVSWIAKELCRPKVSIFSRAHFLGFYKLITAETYLRGRKERAINRFSMLKGIRVQLSTTGWATHTGETVVLGFKNGQHKYAAKMLCEVSKHEFLAPGFRLGNYPRSCPLCITDMGGTRGWTRALATARNFSLPVDAYIALRKSQANSKNCVLCAICSAPEKSKRHGIDHNHLCCSASGKSCGRCIRQLLCQVCNSIVGAVERGELSDKLVPAHRKYIIKWNGIYKKK